MNIIITKGNKTLLCALCGGSQGPFNVAVDTGTAISMRTVEFWGVGGTPSCHPWEVSEMCVRDFRMGPQRWQNRAGKYGVWLLLQALNAGACGNSGYTIIISDQIPGMD